jgi:hypothetical protein
VRGYLKNTVKGSGALEGLVNEKKHFYIAGLIEYTVAG